MEIVTKMETEGKLQRLFWQPLAVTDFLLHPQSSGTLCLSMSGRHHLSQPFANGWKHSCFNSHFPTSSSDITNYVSMDFEMAIYL